MAKGVGCLIDMSLRGEIVGEGSPIESRVSDSSEILCIGIAFVVFVEDDRVLIPVAIEAPNIRRVAFTDFFSQYISSFRIIIHPFSADNASGGVLKIDIRWF